MMRAIHQCSCSQRKLKNQCGGVESLFLKKLTGAGELLFAIQEEKPKKAAKIGEQQEQAHQDKVNGKYFSWDIVKQVQHEHIAHHP